MKTAVLTDSTAYIPDHLIEEKNIYVAPLSVTFGQDTYREFYDITTEEFYEKVKAEKDLPKTSQPSVSEFTTKYEEIAKEHDAGDLGPSFQWHQWDVSSCCVRR